MKKDMPSVDRSKTPWLIFMGYVNLTYIFKLMLAILKMQFGWACVFVDVCGMCMFMVVKPFWRTNFVGFTYHSSIYMLCNSGEYKHNLHYFLI
jgi:hypothetical protein